MSRSLAVVTRGACAALAIGLALGASAPARAWPLVGAQVGAGFFKFQETETPLIELQSMIGFVGGMQAIFPISGPFAIDAGLQFANKGTSLGESEATDPAGNMIGTFETIHSVQYVEFPILARFSFLTNDLISAHATLGPTFAFEMSEQLKTTGAQEHAFDQDDLENFDFGGAVGLGAGVNAGPGVWTFDVRYTRGFTNLDERGFYGGKAYNSGFEIMTGYLYRTGPQE